MKTYRPAICPSGAIVWAGLAFASLAAGSLLAASAASAPVGWEEYAVNVDARLNAHGYIPMESIVVPPGQRQLLVDDYVVEHMENLGRTVHQPVRAPENPVIRADQPWEGIINWASVIQDRPAGLFKAWYLTTHGLAYATSADGVHWSKPNLDLLDWNGSKKNNLVRPLVVSPTIIKDEAEPDPGKRYKCFALEKQPVFGMYVAFSPDGIHWRREDRPVLTTQNDPGLGDRPTMMHDLARHRFIAFTKREIINANVHGDWGFICRSRAYSVSADFLHWTDPILTLHPDDQDPSDLQFYGLVGFNYEGMYLGLIDAFWSGNSGAKENTCDTQLASSRDGEVWWRAGNRQTFLPVGIEESWDQRWAAPDNCAPIKIGQELWFYYNGNAARHRDGVPEQRRREPWNAPGHPESLGPVADNQTVTANPPERPISGVGMARLRVDGFVSVDAGPLQGRLLTRPLLTTGSTLHINADSRRGSIRAEVFEAKKVEGEKTGTNWAIGQPVAGFSLEECVPLRQDTTDGILRWKAGGLERLMGKAIVIRFCLVQGSLYSFWIQ